MLVVLDLMANQIDSNNEMTAVELIRETVAIQFVFEQICKQKDFVVVSIEKCQQRERERDRAFSTPPIFGINFRVF